MPASEPTTGVEAATITAFPTDVDGDRGWRLEPAAARREWMDDTPYGWAYRCLPLVVGNQLGWDIFAPTEFTATWDGGEEPGATVVQFPGGDDRSSECIQSHFGSGIITVFLPWIFRTEEPVGLIVRGPTNLWIDGAAPLEGFVETWGLEATFTMNWKLTTPGRSVLFSRSAPICTLQPYALSLIAEANTKIRDLESEPELRDGYRRWARSRDSFNAGRSDPRSWQQTYSLGEDASGGAVPGHIKRLNLARFGD